MAKKVCAHKKRMIPIVPELMLSECCSYGRLAHLKGAVEEARRLAEAQGGIPYLLNIIEQAEISKRLDRKAESDERYAAERRKFVER